MFAGLLPPAGSYEPMSALDAVFLHTDNDRAPMHLGAVSVFEPGPFVDPAGRFRLDAVRAHVESRLHLLPLFRKKVAEAPLRQGRPVWVDDERFDVRHHVKLVAVPRPGTREQLAELAAWILSHPLDRHRPLWQLWFVEGLEDGRVAMVEKLHHAVADGVSGVDVAVALLDAEPDPDRPPGPDWSPRRPPDPVQLLVRAELDRLARPSRWGSRLLGSLPGPRDVVAAIDGAVDALRSVVDMATRSHPLVERISSDRALTWTTLPLSEVRDVAHDHGVTVNDVALALVAGGVHRVLAERGPVEPDSEVEVVVPVSTRPDDHVVELGNSVSAILVRIPVGDLVPSDRLDAVNRAMAAHKAHHQARGTGLALDGLEAVGPVTLALVAQAMHHQPVADLVVTNVPGPQIPLYFMGARMVEAVPVVPLGGNLAMGIAVLSYDDDLCISVVAHGDAAADARTVVAGVRADAQVLLGDR